MSKLSKHRRLAVGAAVATLAIGGVACSDDDDVDDPVDSIQDDVEGVVDSVQDDVEGVVDSIQDEIDGDEGGEG